MFADLKYALRQFAKNPVFSAIAVLILALGIGANTAIFSVVDATLLKWLPVPKPGQLVILTWDASRWPPALNQTGGNASYSFSYPAFERFRQDRQIQSDLFAFVPLGFTPQNATVTLDGSSSTADGVMVSGNYFSGLGAAPILGRGVSEADEPAGAPRVAVISHAYWVRQFNRDPAIVGRTLTINSVLHTIVGVAPANFHGIMPFEAAAPDFWIPFTDLPNLRPWGFGTPGGHSFYQTKNFAFLSIAGRLPPGAPRAETEARLDADYRNLLLEDWKPKDPAQVPHLAIRAGGRGIAGLREQLVPPFAILMTAAGLLLTVACANLAILLLARAGSRQREMSVRLAVGAPRWRLVRQLLIESLVLAAAGGAAGLLVAQIGIHALLGMLWREAGQMGFEVRIDWTVLGFAGLVSLLAGILFGLAPALRVAQADLASAMKQAAGSISEAGRPRRLGKILVVAQVAVSSALVVAAGLFVRSLRAMESRDLGFERQGLYVFGLDPTREGYAGSRLANLYEKVRGEVRALPSVQDVTLYDNLPYNGSSNTYFKLVGSDRKVPDSIVRWETVGPDFCRTMRIRLLAGRDIRDTDTAASTPVGLVNQTFVQRFCGDANPIGQRFTGPSGRTAFEIVGVFKEVELVDLHSPPKAKAFVPYAQIPGRLNTMFFEVRAAGDPGAVAAGLRLAVRRIDSNLPLLNFSTQTEVVSSAMLMEEVLARLAGLFGTAALILSCIGLYGTMAYTVAQRTKEIGIRVTLGATPRMILGMILSQGTVLIAAGAGAGLLASLGLTRFFRGMLYGVAQNDPTTFGAAATLIAVVALLACYLPARRATQVDPIVALRTE